MIATVFVGDPDGRADYFLDHAPRSTVKGDYVTALDLRICWSGGNSLFSCTLMAYAMLVVLTAPRDIVRAPIDRTVKGVGVTTDEGRRVLLSHESSIAKFRGIASFIFLFFGA